LSSLWNKVQRQQRLGLLHRMNPLVALGCRKGVSTFEEFALGSDALARLAVIVRGADTGQLELTPQSPGLLAASLGYSRMYRDDLAQLEAAMPLYDAFYRWCRDAVNETHA